MADAPQTTEVVDIAALARALVRQLIDVGAECQKARTFTVVPSDGPLRYSGANGTGADFCGAPNSI